jgi:hypothetical protein
MNEFFINPTRRELNEKTLQEAIDRLPIFCTDDDIKRYLGFQTKIYKYSELNNIEDITHILPQNKTCCIILIENERNTGHFVALGRKDNIIIQFDSYGSTIDYELKFIPNVMMRILGEERNTIKNLIEKSGLPTTHNKTRYQNTKKVFGLESSICGRACIVFCQLIMLNYSLEEMKDFINYKKYEYENLFDVESLPYDVIFSLLVR